MRRNSARGAFTLIELLVVITIIAILAALLLPVLGKAKDQSKTSACVNNSRQLAVACHIYLTDNYDKFCDTSVVRGDNVTRRAWFDLIFPYTTTTNLLLCPAFQLKAGAIVAPNSIPPRRRMRHLQNYALNFQVGGFDWPGIWPESAYPPARLSAVHKPAATCSCLLTVAPARCQYH